MIKRVPKGAEGAGRFTSHPSTDADIFLNSRGSRMEKRARLASSPTSPSTALLACLTDQDETVRRLAAMNPMLPESGVIVAATDSDPTVRAEAMKHRKATPDIIMSGLEDKVPGVRWAAASRTDLSIEHIEIMMSSDDFVLRERAKRLLQSN